MKRAPLLIEACPKAQLHEVGMCLIINMENFATYL